MSLDTLDGLASALGFGAGWGAKALARAVGPAGGKLTVAALSEPVARALEQAGHTPVRAPVQSGRLPLDDASADALCVSGLPDDAAPDTALALLREYARTVRTEGKVLMATAAGLARRGPDRQLICALFLHASLIDLDQRMSRGTVITSGRVRR
ncbi:MAG TPA: class I SAM-dependent methyltransferase [Kofleriaceae bacterium]|nr:class I SAM-dependent methyltransferase [Kofleriaceae bacterium]